MITYHSDVTHTRFGNNTWTGPDGSGFTSTDAVVVAALDLVARQRQMPTSNATGNSDGTAVGLNEWRTLPQLRQRAVFLLCEFYRRENSPGSSLTDFYTRRLRVTNHFDL